MQRKVRLEKLRQLEMLVSSENHKCANIRAEEKKFNETCSR